MRSKDPSSFYKQNTLPDAAEANVPIPSEIGPYKIESPLNKGSMSILYLGMDPKTKELRTIKVLSPLYINHAQSVERFLKEAKIVGMTDHPNIVKLYGQGQWEGGLYIAMEFIRGISLRQFIMQQSLSLRRSLEIVLQVAYALCHLHTHGVIHRDLKPENILITEDGEIKVIDFGIAQLHEESHEETHEKTMGGATSGNKQIIGTPSYMSPEQKEDPTKVSFASDIYSLGIIAYELILGKLSYGLVNSSLLPQGLRKIIEKALAISVSERYQDIVDLITDISEYLESKEGERERPDADQLKEWQETLYRAQSNLSPSFPPSWPAIEMGLAKHKFLMQAPLYYDMFKFPDNTYGIVLAESASPDVDGAIYIGVLRGQVRSLLDTQEPTIEKPFDLFGFATDLNQLVASDPIEQRFSFLFLVLDPLREQLSFISCGHSLLFHVPETSGRPRKLSSENPLLGESQSDDFTVTTDNWKVGDLLLLHSFPTLSAASELENKLTSLISETALFSPQRQAETIIKKLASVAAGRPPLLLSIRRIA